MLFLLLPVFFFKFGTIKNVCLSQSSAHVSNPSVHFERAHHALLFLPHVSLQPEWIRQNNHRVKSKQKLPSCIKHAFFFYPAGLESPTCLIHPWETLHMSRRGNQPIDEIWTDQISSVASCLRHNQTPPTAADSSRDTDWFSRLLTA